MKKAFCLLFGIFSVIGLAGCAESKQQQLTSRVYNMYDGYLKIEDNKLLVNDFKFIDRTEQYWIDNLGLTEADMPDGYYIYDNSDEEKTFYLNVETRYNFYDTGRQFVSETDENILYTTTDINDFLKKFDSDGDGDLDKTPFKIQVFEDGNVISVSEIFVN